MRNQHMHYDEADAGAALAFASANSVELRQDDAILFARNLDYVKTRVYEAKLPPLSGLAVIPQATDTPEYAESITYQVFDMVGMAKVIANYADDLPRVDVAGTPRTVPVRTIGDSYGYNVNELRASTALGAALPERKARAARLAIEVKLNKIAMVGDPEYGLEGFTTHPNIGTTTITTGDWGNGSTTAEQILTDFETLYTAVINQSQGVHVPNTFLTAQSAVSNMRTKRFAAGVNTGASVYEVIRAAYPDVQIVGIVELNDASGSRNAFMGEFSLDNAALELVMPFNQLPAQARNLELVVPCQARTGGVTVHYPLAFTKAATNLV